MREIGERKIFWDEENHKIMVLAIILAGACYLTYYFHVVVGTGTVFTHFFYIPIILASMWWRRRGLAVAVFLAAFLIFSHFFIRPSVETIDDLIRAPMFIAVALVTAILSERIMRVEESLRDSEETALALLNAPTEAAILITSEGSILALNEIAAKRLGRSADELIGANIYDLIPSTLAESRKARVEAVIRSGNSVCFEDEREGMVFHQCFYPIFDAQGKVARLAIFAHDITSRKRAEEELKKKNKELEEAYRMRENFLQETSHRIITPVSIIGGNADLLLESSNLDDDQKAKIAAIRERNEEILKLVRDALTGKYLEEEEEGDG